MGERKNYRWYHLVMGLALLMLAVSGIWASGTLLRVGQDTLLRNMVMAAMGMAIVGLLVRQETTEHMLQYDNEEHVLRFYLCLFICLIIAVACVFLPAGAWPFLVIYVALALYGSTFLGVVAGSVLLMITALGSGVEAHIFVMYLISGIIGVTLFRFLDTEFKVGVPFAISLMGLLVCETANVVLFANERLDMELFVIPVANVIISAVLLLGILKLFSQAVIYRYRVDYMELTAPECKLLSRLKEEAQEDYYQSMHTSYFCERIASKLGLDAQAVKAAGFYHKIGVLYQNRASQNQDSGEDEGTAQERDFEDMGTDVFDLFNRQHFPPAMQEILKEYLLHDRTIRRRETAVLVMADAVTAAIIHLLAANKGRDLDYDKIIDSVFRIKLESGILNHCQISLLEITQMKMIFKEEKLYYDFLR
ncbi:MAG: hypothetical protein NC543_15460 [bacterium]|nr:hypothetical protein [bacterium]MCM1376660.1 hypothetical protein [Muribaculum sp.]